MNEEIAIKICEQMTSDVHDLCICCRKNEKDRTCIGCRELAIETILKENARLKDKNQKAFKIVDEKLTNLNLEYGINNEFREEYDELWEILKEN